MDKKTERLLVELVRLKQKIKEFEASQKEQKKLLRSLGEVEEHYKQIYDEAPVGYHELDRKGQILRMNRTELEMLGYTAEDMLGIPVWEFVVEEEMTRQVTLA
ncbi:MAG: PAS domain-containing protein, partial [Deltaproteobacteria bacterium]|nr:PAS domain-containing protein [Deltaproteobacteria bacterium]